MKKTHGIYKAELSRRDVQSIQDLLESMVGHLKYAKSESIDVFSKFQSVEELYEQKWPDDDSGTPDQFLDELSDIQDEIKRIQRDLESTAKYFDAQFGNLGK